MKSKVIMALTIKITVFWAVTQCLLGVMEASLQQSKKAPIDMNPMSWIL
jgi:hypothetical protein